MDKEGNLDLSDHKWRLLPKHSQSGNPIKSLSLAGNALTNSQFLSVSAMITNLLSLDLANNLLDADCVVQIMTKFLNLKVQLFNKRNLEPGCFEQ